MIKKITTALEVLAALLLLSAGVYAQTEVAKLQASDKQAGDLFGVSVAISCDRAIATCLVTVPKSQNGNPAVDDGPAQTVVSNCGVGSASLAAITKNGPLNEPMAASKELQAEVDLAVGSDDPAANESADAEQVRETLANLARSADDAVIAETLPEDYELMQNYPNPFNPSTTITFAVPEAGEVTLAIYNLHGQLIQILYSGAIAAGQHSVVWNGADFRGVKVASGLYVYRLKAKGFVATKKLVLTK